MATTIDQQVALDESFVPSTQRLRIGRSNFRLPSDIQSKKSTLQVVYDIDTKKSVLDLEAFREMLRISPRIPSQSFAELPSKEEILDFLRFLGHSHEIRYLTDVNVNKLYQPWRSFASVINKCLTSKSSSVDSFRLSQAQILWGFYHRINIDFAYLIWEDFVYQVEHKNQKRSNEMNYPRFTKVIIDYFMTRKPSISRRNRINWHYVRDEVMFSTIKVASARKKKGDSASSTTPPTPTPTTTVKSALRLSATAKGKQPARAITPTESTYVERTEAEQLKIVLKRSRQETHISQQHGLGTDEGTEEEESFDPIPKTLEGSEDECNDEEDQEVRLSEEARIQEQEEADELYRDVNINQGSGLQVTQNVEDSHVTLTPFQPDGLQESSSVSSFVT
nr:hypothetical protein [Tanacetum cinerariifolium]